LQQIVDALLAFDKAPFFSQKESPGGDGAAAFSGGAQSLNLAVNGFEARGS
jgi:hypothetical protein